MGARAGWLVGLIAAAACSSSVPATTPVTTVTTTTAPTSVTSTTAPTSVTSTTLDRVGEIEAIFQDLEQRRLTALYEGDVAAFSALFANEEYLARSLEAFELAEFDAPPIVELEVLEILADEETCIAARISLNRTPSIVAVLEEAGGRWGYSFIGEGWQCVGPHPFSS